MDFRKIFDSVPEEFDKWRSRYCDELFADVIEFSNLDASKTALEIGPGTGQATEPILKTGCSYMAVELGENLAEFIKNKFSTYPNFKIVNDDFVTYDLGQNQFDLVYSAATIQWIPEAISFPKVYDILKSGGAFAMFFTQSDYKSPNESLYAKIQEVYDDYFRPETKYTCRLNYFNAQNYGFADFEYRQYQQIKEYNADDYVSLISTHSDHLTLQEPYKTKFYTGIRDAIGAFGNKIVLNNTISLYLLRKP